MNNTKKILWLYWFHSTKSLHGNFGDELSYYIINKLTYYNIKRLPFPRSGLMLFLSSIRGYLLGRNKIDDIINSVHFIISKSNYLLAIGSIIGWGSGPRRVVWGSGIISKNDNIPKGTFLAVRGPITNNRLKEVGYPTSKVIGDPAILLPLVYKKEQTKGKYKVGLVLHHYHANQADDFKLNKSLLVIQLKDDIEYIIDQIRSCEFIISSSLHGIIVSHAYGIPALRLKFNKIPLMGDDIKFLDYLYSVGIENDSYVEIESIKNLNEDDLIAILERKACLPSINVLDLQKDLLSCAPFGIKKEYVANEI